MLAQEPLAIGDSVPGIRFDNLVNYSLSNANVSDFKGKLVIIDFWATWCAACLHAFGKLDSLQSMLGDQLKIILVNSKSTGDDLPGVRDFFSKWKTRTGKNLSLPAAVNDILVDKLFPHHLIPHYVWISKEGKLLAVTSSEAVTAANIQSAYRGEQLSFTMKKDQDATRPVFSTADLPGDKLLNYCVFLKKWFDGLPSGNQVRQRGEVICGRAMTNTSILDMYKMVATGIDASISGKNFLISNIDSSELFPPLEAAEREAWYRQHAYTLDLVVPVEEAARLYQRMLEMLNNYSGYNGRFEKRKMKCWVLLRSSSINRIKTTGEKTVNHLWVNDKPFLKNGTTDMLLKRLNSLPDIQYPFLVETGYRQNIDISFPRGIGNFQSIREQLLESGFILKLEQRVINLFVL